MNVRISQATHNDLQAYLRATGMRLDHLVEQAIRHALQEVPTSKTIRPPTVISPRTGESVLREMEAALPMDPERDVLRDGD